jgi:hypothetical protein
MTKSRILKWKSWPAVNAGAKQASFAQSMVNLRVSKRMLPLDAMSRMPFDKFQIYYIPRHENTNILAQVLGYHVARRATFSYYRRVDAITCC